MNKSLNFYFKHGLDVIAEVLKYVFLGISFLLMIVALFLVSISGALIYSEWDKSYAEEEGIVESTFESIGKLVDKETWKWNPKRIHKY